MNPTIIVPVKDIFVWVFDLDIYRKNKEREVTPHEIDAIVNYQLPDGTSEIHYVLSDHTGIFRRVREIFGFIAVTKGKEPPDKGFVEDEVQVIVDKIDPKPLPVNIVLESPKTE